MSDFLFNNYDYVDCIKTEEDMKLFKRLRELEPELRKPAADCIKAIIEVIRIEDKLQGLPERKIFFVPNPNLN